MQLCSTLPAVLPNVSIAAPNSVDTSLAAEHSVETKLICRWFPTGKPYPKLVAEWVIEDHVEPYTSETPVCTIYHHLN